MWWGNSDEKAHMSRQLRLKLRRDLTAAEGMAFVYLLNPQNHELRRDVKSAAKDPEAFEEAVRRLDQLMKEIGQDTWEDT